MAVAVELLVRLAKCLGEQIVGHKREVVLFCTRKQSLMIDDAFGCFPIWIFTLAITSLDVITPLALVWSVVSHPGIGVILARWRSPVLFSRVLVVWV